MDLPPKVTDESPDTTTGVWPDGACGMAEMRVVPGVGAPAKQTHLARVLLEVHRF